MDNQLNIQTVAFGGGCFWCTEAIFDSLKGITNIEPGYSGGTKENPTYEEVSTGNTGHAEAVKIEYDPKQVSFSDLLSVFFNTHNPTTLNRQGNDIGSQYRSVIFFTNEEQKREAENLIDELNKTKAYPDPVVTQVEPLKNFFKAEDYHKNYYESHKDAPYCEIIIAPKLEKLNQKFKELLS